jgi:hypothetical protein
MLFRKKADSARTKKAKLRNDYRARLCENLAYYLRSIYRSQTPDRLRAQLREQQKNRKGHPIKETNRTMNTSLKRYADLMLIAMVHLPGDPIVQDWAGSKRACGDKRYLRRARKGLEKGVKTPYRTSAQALGDLTTIELGMEGKSPAEIREELLAKKLPPRSKEGIRKRLKVILALDK